MPSSAQRQLLNRLPWRRAARVKSEPWWAVDEAELLQLFKDGRLPPADFASIEQRAATAGFEQKFEEHSDLRAGGFLQTKVWAGKSPNGLFALIASGGGRPGSFISAYGVFTHDGFLDRALAAMRAEFGEPSGCIEDGPKTIAVWRAEDKHMTITLTENTELDGPFGLEMKVEFERGSY